jgi:hypothetical protein
MEIEHHFANVMGRLFPVVGFAYQSLIVEANFGNDFEKKKFRWAEGMDTRCAMGRALE